MQIDPRGSPTYHDFEWSSHLDYAGEREPFEWLDLSWLRYWGRTKTRGQAEYRKEVASFFGKPIPIPWDDLRGGLVLGGSALWERTRGLMAQKLTRIGKALSSVES